MVIEVLEVVTWHWKGDCLATELRGTLPERDLVSLLGETKGGGNSCIAATDNSNVFLSAHSSSVRKNREPGRLYQSRPVLPIPDEGSKVLDKERGEHQRDRRQQFDQHVQRGTGRVLPRISDRISDHRGGVRIAALAEDVAGIILESA
jgi:hypothetical protein